MKIEIQGRGAVKATEELLSIEGLEGSYEVPEGLERGEPLTTIATIVGIVGGTMAIAEQIRKWYQEYKQNRSGENIDRVLFVRRDGQRLLLSESLLDEETIKKIEQILEE